jgi:hypothetical protein
MAIVLTGCLSAGQSVRPLPKWPGSEIFEAPNPAYGIGGNDAVVAIGGGSGYDDWHERAVLRVVATQEELLMALAAAEAGDVIYVDDQASIDLTGLWDIRIRAGVTLASGRGYQGSPGAQLYTQANETKSLFVVRDGGVRITGLRLQGPSTVEKPGGCPENARGILVRGVSTSTISPTVEIDNNELWGWPNAAVTVDTMPGVHIHHNHIHHNRRVVEPKTKDSPDGCAEGGYGLGYGVNISGTHALIDANRFDYNRHDIASSGAPGSGYTARYNLILSQGTSHSFDMHGFGEQRSIGKSPPYEAGSRIVIHHNLFLNPNHPAIVMRGTPKIGAWIYQNVFAGGETTIRQRNTDESGKQNYPPNPIHLYIENNQYNAGSSP